MAAKYFVWGEGVWRELDVASGRVSGWRRRARFVFLRRGQLLVARRRPVLRALEALAAGKAGAAADGRRLAHRSKSESHARQRHEQPAPPAPPAAPALACVHHHCCAHGGCLDRAPALPAAPAPTSGVARCEAATQCSRDAATGPERASTPSDKQQPAPAATNTAPLTVAASDSSSANEFLTNRAPMPPPALTRDKPRVNNVSALLGKHAPPSTLPAAIDKRRTSRMSPAAATAKRQTLETRADQPGDKGARRARTRARTTVVSDKTESTSDDEPLARGSHRSAPAVCKELVVSEADIAALRGFVARTRPTALLRFDADDAYKRALFYAINPLVELERCARLERLLASRSAVALPHFAARLGLAPSSSVSAPPSPARRTRLAVRRPRATSASSDTDKENKNKHSSPNKMRNKPAGATKTPPRPERARPRPAERSTKQEKDVAAMKAPLTNGVARDAPTVKCPAPTNKALLESEDSGVAPSVSDVKIPSVPRHVISKRASRANAKEYSNLEDHAIVAWVSAGARASLVGGNRVWRELQEQYPRLTGRERSWHSLRNRYLRYILPALGALHLPPADVSRLRAAASTGAIRRQNRASGPLAAPRHPMFKEPERGAASRRLRAVSSDDSDGPVAPKRRSLRVRPLDSSSKDESSKESPSKVSGSKETSNKDESGKESTSKPSCSKEVNSKASGSQAPGSKAPGSKAPGSKTLGSKTPGSKAPGSKTPGSKAGSKKAGSSRAASPRYSDVTRRFAARRRAAATSSSASPVTSRSPSPLLTPARSRRLFNPNANV